MRSEDRISLLSNVQELCSSLEDESHRKFIYKLARQNVLDSTDRMTLGDENWRFCSQCLLAHLKQIEAPCRCFICVEERKGIPTRWCRDRNRLALDEMFHEINKKSAKR